MSRNSVFIISEDKEVIEKAKAYWLPLGVTVHVYSQPQWTEGLENPFFRSQLALGLPALSVGVNPVTGGSINGSTTTPNNVVPFPGGNRSTDSATVSSKLATIDELESKAIENAIFQFRGNLTEAARALGIGRATLYRKVKQYQIDPNQARRKQAA